MKKPMNSMFVTLFMKITLAFGSAPVVMADDGDKRSRPEVVELKDARPKI